MQAGEGLTALRFDDSGLQCAVGTTNGLVALFDLRASRPTIVKDHMYGAAIRDIKFHTADSMAGMTSILCLTFTSLCGLQSILLQEVRCHCALNYSKSSRFWMMRAGGTSRNIISADSHIVKVWDASSGENFTNLQPQEPGINDMLHWKGSGLIMMGLDAPRIQACTLN